MVLVKIIRGGSLCLISLLALRLSVNNFYITTTMTVVSPPAPATDDWKEAQEPSNDEAHEEESEDDWKEAQEPSNDEAMEEEAEINIENKSNDKGGSSTV